MNNYSNIGKFDIYCSVCGNSDLLADKTDFIFRCRNCGNTNEITSKEEIAMRNHNNLSAFSFKAKEQGYKVYAYTPDVIKSRISYIVVGVDNYTVYIQPHPYSGYDYHFKYISRDQPTLVKTLVAQRGADLSIEQLLKCVDFGTKFINSDVLVTEAEVSQCLASTCLSYSKI